MAVQTLPKVNLNVAKVQTQQAVNQLGGTNSSQIAASNQTQQQQFIATAVAANASGSNTTQGGLQKQLVSGNLVKLVNPHSVGGGKLIMNKSNILQVGKMTTSTLGGKPAFVITNKQGQQLTNQQIIIVTTGASIRSIPSTASVMTNANTGGSNIVSIVGATGTTSSASITTTRNVLATGQAGIKMIRGVANSTGRPITLTLPPAAANQQIQSNSQKVNVAPTIQQKTITLGGKAVTVQMSTSSAISGNKTIVIHLGKSFFHSTVIFRIFKCS